MIDSNMDNFAFMLVLFYFYLIVLLNLMVYCSTFSSKRASTYSLSV